MKNKNVLVTGGAGFIGSWTVDFLIQKGYNVRIIDNLQPRVHPNGKPQWLSNDAEFFQGDVASKEDMSIAMEDMDYIIHLAAYQDYMPDFSTFIHTNIESSALIFELAVKDPKRFPVKKVVFASSQSVSGEGKYICPSCANKKKINLNIIKSDISKRVNAYDIPKDSKLIITPFARSLEQLKTRDWEHHCQTCGEILLPVLMDEDTISPVTTYGISKYTIELLADRLGKRYNIPSVCMRYTCAQGSHNSFYNAYSGIARRFAMQLMQGLPLTIYEDGNQLRDYINVKDVASANILAMEDGNANFRVFNVGGKRAITVLEFAKIMIKEFGSNVDIVIPNEFRVGDTRHTVSDTSQLETLGWKPKIQIEQNVAEYVEWIQQQTGSKEYVKEADKIMRQQGIVQYANIK